MDWSSVEAQVISRTGSCFHVMRRSRVWAGADGVIGEVTDRLGHGAEGGRQLDPTHGAGERDADKLRLVSVLGEDDR